MQGVQPKGVDENGMAINPVGKTIKSIFPYYLHSTGIGGPARRNPLKVEELTIEDLVAAVKDVRENADRVYRDIFNEFSYVTDHLRAVQPEWVAEARESMKRQQEMVVENLKEKVEQAPETTSDEFLYQDKAEATPPFATRKSNTGHGIRSLINDIAVLMKSNLCFCDQFH